MYVVLSLKLPVDCRSCWRNQAWETPVQTFQFYLKGLECKSLFPQLSLSLSLPLPPLGTPLYSSRFFLPPPPPPFFFILFILAILLLVPLSLPFFIFQIPIFTTAPVFSCLCPFLFLSFISPSSPPLLFLFATSFYPLCSSFSLFRKSLRLF